MKFLFSLFVSLLIGMIPANLFSYEIKVQDGAIRTSKFRLNGVAIWTNAERNRLIAESVDTGTGTIKLGDFISDAPSADEVEILNEIEADGSFKTRSDVLQELRKRKSRAYNFRKLRECRAERNSSLSVREADPSFDVSASTGALEADFQKFRSRYQGATE